MTKISAGTRIGDYEIHEELGRGAMGVVYRALDRSLDRIVALKILPPHLAESAEYVARFNREARAAARLNHPNIVTIYRFGPQGEFHTIAMEYVEGMDLASFIEARGKIETDLALDMARQMASALAAAHGVKVIHRDIKSRNIMVGPMYRIKVMDFGIAKICGSDSALSTVDGKIIGTPAFMAPEQFYGKPLDNRCDIFALGVVLYQMLTGCGPFEADTPGAVIQRILNETPPPIEETNPGIPVPVVRLVNRALAKNPEERFQSTNQFLAALDRASLAAIKPPSPGIAITTEIHEIPTIMNDPERAGGEKKSKSPRRGVGWLIGSGVLVCSLALFLHHANSQNNTPTADTSGNFPVAGPSVESAYVPLVPVQKVEVQAIDTREDTAPTSESYVGSLIVRKPAEGKPPAADVSPISPTHPTASPKSRATRQSAREELPSAIEFYNGTHGAVDERKTREIVSRAAEERDPLGQMWCAWFSHWGRCGFEKNSRKVAEWSGGAYPKVRKLAEQGDADAMFLTGAALDARLGTQENAVKAREWITKAANAGQTTAMNYLGYMHFAGRGGPADMNQAFEWFQRGATAGDVNAMHNLGKLYADGTGVAQNNEAAIVLFRRAAEIGSPVNMIDLGWMYEKGLGVPQNRDHAILWYGRAADMGDPLAVENLQKLGARSKH